MQAIGCSDFQVQTDDQKSVIVEMPHERYRQLGLKREDLVFVSVRDARVFLEDYSI